MKIINPDLWSLRQKLRWFVILPPSLAVLLLTAFVVSIVSKNEVEQQAEQVAQREDRRSRAPGGQLLPSRECPDPEHSLASKGTGT